MQRSLLLLAGLALAGVGAAAQSVQWTGHYYIAVADAANAPAAVVGAHGGWNAPEAIDALAGGSFVDLAVRQLPSTASALVPDHRYDLLVVGVGREGPVAIEGFENEGSPYFGPAVPLEGVGAPHAAIVAGEDYLVVASRPASGPVLTGDYVVAFGRPAKWEIVPGPDFRGGVFVDIALAPSSPASEAVVQLVAVGALNGEAYAIPGLLVDGRPTFDVRMERLPQITQPVAVAWTGSYFAVMGLDAAGSTTLVYGVPGDWMDSKTLVTNGMLPTDLAVSPIAVRGARQPRDFDLLAIGQLKDRVATIAGIDAGGFPLLHPEWAFVPGLGTQGDGTPLPEAIAAAAETRVSGVIPNPASARARMSITLAREQAVLVEVFDGIGRRVAMLHNGVLPAGTETSFAFDAEGMPSGTYHFRINGVDFSEVRSFTLAR